MNEQEITNRLVAAHKAIVEKLEKQPMIPPYIVINGSGRVYCSLYHHGTESGSIYGDSFDECLNAVDAFIAAMPNPQDAKLHNHMKRVADCIDKGREDGIDDAYIAPLVVVKAAMTENLLTKGDVK